MSDDVTCLPKMAVFRTAFSTKRRPVTQRFVHYKRWSQSNELILHDFANELNDRIKALTDPQHQRHLAMGSAKPQDWSHTLDTVFNPPSTGG